MKFFIGEGVYEALPSHQRLTIHIISENKIEAWTNLKSKTKVHHIGCLKTIFLKSNPYANPLQV